VEPAPQNTCTAFAGHELLASGDLATVALAVKRVLDAGEERAVHIFDDVTSQLVEIDFRGTPDEVAARIAGDSGAKPDAPRGPGRPKLGVVGREVTLLPRHWEWLATQPGGASVTLRKLVEEARRTRRGEDEMRRSQDAAYRFMTALAGDLLGYEEATRALYAHDEQRFNTIVELWPAGVSAHAKRVAAGAWR
jgi:hypothetical protein